jgi:hypothetical protein
MTLRSMREIEEHECDSEGSSDIDICRGCGEHAGFCSICEVSDCCGEYPYMPE